MNERKSYTAQEMREMEAIVASGDIGSMTRKRVALMLKQAVEMRARKRRGWSDAELMHGSRRGLSSQLPNSRKDRKMAESKNALAELAERLSNDAEYLYGNNDKASEDVSKAQRIVAELAKVSDGRWEVICDGPPAYFCTAGDLRVQCAIGRCRVIAEEGVKDGE